ncbi:hypothetical protein KEM60_00465 [Austwickia sp. TVS 96-490-7B]|uniref:hypothetical protein n=1 Tax=Austwickia sp. TVS 96-490-7B TaxID=2830843 RepID=UPI001C59A84E|nr:hypothetical protein [Austwickia sp. TVS 96-490-7B]MBW3084278.1 hypothetical protein [Austwickia sp. TVS 96-490-7B]
MPEDSVIDHLSHLLSVAVLTALLWWILRPSLTTLGAIAASTYLVLLLATRLHHRHQRRLRRRDDSVVSDQDPTTPAPQPPTCVP